MHDKLGQKMKQYIAIIDVKHAIILRLFQFLNDMFQLLLPAAIAIYVCTNNYYFGTLIADASWWIKPVKKYHHG